MLGKALLFGENVLNLYDASIGEAVKGHRIQTSEGVTVNQDSSRL